MGRLVVLSWASKSFAFKLEVDRKWCFFESKWECHGFPWLSFLLLMSVITEWMFFTAPQNKVPMLGMFPTEPEGKHRQLHAVRALHALAKVLKAHEDLLWSLLSK